MEWYEYLAYFGAGLFLANGVPHFVNGISGRRFQTPFASPPAVGESSPLVNVVWAFVNFVCGGILLQAAGGFVAGTYTDDILIGTGAFATALILAWHFGRVRGSV